MATDEEGRSTEGAGASNGGGNQLLSALKSKELLIPAAISAVGAVAATGGPGIVRRLTQATEGKGREEAEKLGRSALEGAKSGLTKALPGGGGGVKKTRRLPIERWTDVAVPIESAYSAWLDFDRWPQFMHRVQNVRRKDDDRIEWQEKIWFSKRQWEGRITERRKNDRIAWKTTSGMSHRGVVSFHRLGDNLTRVMVTMEFEPQGMVEKMASGMRFVKRAVQADLARYKAFVEMKDAKGIEYRAKDDDRQNGNSSRSGRSKDDSTRDNERRERESRREERREAVAG